jgi:transposase
MVTGKPPPLSLACAVDLSSHKGPKVRQLIEAAGAALLYLPPYSPDFNPIEKAFAKLKALLRKAEARTREALWQTIGKLIDTITPSECQHYFDACGYPLDTWMPVQSDGKPL